MLNPVVSGGGIPSWRLRGTVSIASRRVRGAGPEGSRFDGPGLSPRVSLS